MDGQIRVSSELPPDCSESLKTSRSCWLWDCRRSSTSRQKCRSPSPTPFRHGTASVNTLSIPYQSVLATAGTVRRSRPAHKQRVANVARNLCSLSANPVTPASGGIAHSTLNLTFSDGYPVDYYPTVTGVSGSLIHCVNMNERRPGVPVTCCSFDAPLRTHSKWYRTFGTTGTICQVTINFLFHSPTAGRVF